MNIEEMKKQARHEEVENLRTLCFTKIEAVWRELEFIKKVCRNLSSDDLDNVPVACLYEFITTIAVTEIETTKEEFLKEMGDLFDEATSLMDETIANQEVDDEDDEPPTNIGKRILAAVPNDDEKPS